MDRTTITFKQAEGLEALPDRLLPKKLSRQLRSSFWNYIYKSMSASTATDFNGRSFVQAPWRELLLKYHTQFLYEPLDEFETLTNHWVKHFKELFYNGSYADVLTFMEWWVRLDEVGAGGVKSVNAILEKHQAAYLITGNPPSVVLASTPEEAEAIIKAIEITSNDFLSGSNSHLLKAAEFINASLFRDSIRESIHAVESIARVIDGKSKKTLKPALKVLSDAKAIHPALNEALSKLYGYTNDEAGIRHSLIDEAKENTIHEATFMLGSCASFITYLISNAREAGLIDK